MSLLSPPPAQRGGAQPPDDVEDLLRAFYKAQVPDPWPSLEAPAPRRTPPPATIKRAAGWPLMRSRLAVAASVALLLGGSLLLAGAFQGRVISPADPIKVNGGSASSENDPLQHPKHPEIPIRGEIKAPAEGKPNENLMLIQEPGGTVIKVIEVGDLPPAK